MFEGIDFDSIEDSISSLSNDSISKLFKIVDNYMKKNYLKENDNDEYYIRVNGVKYLIGYTFVYDGFYYIKRIKSEENENRCFELEDILNDRLTTKEQAIKSRIEDINRQLMELKREGVSLRLIKRSISVNE